MRVPQQQIADVGVDRRRVRWSHGILVMALLSAVIAGVSVAMPSGTTGIGGTSDLSEDSNDRAEDSTASAQARPTFPVKIRKPSGPPRVLTDLTDSHGMPITVACSTCHTTRPPNAQNKTVGDLDEFHKGMTFTHGTVSCLSCHNSSDYDSLKLADGTRVEFTDVMTLCGQCHGPQLTDYNHGAHGGMNGYWDLTRGPKVKNNCVDCHNPHAPQFPRMQPTFKPRDRFLETPRMDH